VWGIEAMMNQRDVLTLFKQEAEKFDQMHYRKNDIILSFSQLIANSSEHLSQENFDALVHIGAIIYKEWVTQTNARSDIATIMKDSIVHEEGC
jgi:hypothetical protein